MASIDFEQHYSATIESIEERVDERVNDLDCDLDCETMNNVLTITCPDQSQIIITPQGPLEQLWVAARSGGFHFAWKGEMWVCTQDNESLAEKLDTIFEDQAGIQLGL